MALIVGDPACTTGYAKAVRDELVARMQSADPSNPELAAMAYAIAKAGIEYFKANAVVTVTLPGGSTATGSIT